jgi:hypothetical protein
MEVKKHYCGFNYMLVSVERQSEMIAQVCHRLVHRINNEPLTKDQVLCEIGGIHGMVESLKYFAENIGNG